MIDNKYKLGQPLYCIDDDYRPYTSSIRGMILDGEEVLYETTDGIEFTEQTMHEEGVYVSEEECAGLIRNAHEEIAERIRKEHEERMRSTN